MMLWSATGINLDREQYIQAIRYYLVSGSQANYGAAYHLNGQDGFQLSEVERRVKSAMEAMKAYATNTELHESSRANTKTVRLNVARSVAGITLLQAIRIYMNEIVELCNNKGHVFLDVDKKPVEGPVTLQHIVQRCSETSRRKSGDYAGHNDPFRNFRKCEYYDLPVDIGIIYRLTDKFSRYETLSTGKENEVKDESLIDTMVDTCNYLAILLLYWDMTDIT